MVVALSLFHAFALMANVLSVRQIMEHLFLEVWILSIAFILTLAIGRELLGRSASRPVTMSSDLGGLKPWLLVVLVCIPQAAQVDLRTLQQSAQASHVTLASPPAAPDPSEKGPAQQRCWRTCQPFAAQSNGELSG